MYIIYVYYIYIVCVIMCLCVCARLDTSQHISAWRPHLRCCRLWALPGWSDCPRGRWRSQRPRPPQRHRSCTRQRSAWRRANPPGAATNERGCHDLNPDLILVRKMLAILWYACVLLILCWIVHGDKIWTIKKYPSWTTLIMNNHKSSQIFTKVKEKTPAANVLFSDTWLFVWWLWMQVPKSCSRRRNSPRHGSAVVGGRRGNVLLFVLIFSVWKMVPQRLLRVDDFDDFQTAKVACWSSKWASKITRVAPLWVEKHGCLRRERGRGRDSIDRIDR